MAAISETALWMPKTGPIRQTSMAGLQSLSAFLAFCEERGPRFVHPIPRRTPYEQMLDDLADGDPAVRTAFNWARQAQNLAADEVLAEWRRYAETERAGIRRMVRVTHRLMPPPSPHALAQLRSVLGDVSPELLDLYQRHNGASLFVDTDDEGNGLFFYPLSEMPAERETVADRLDPPAMETIEDGRLQVYGRPTWLDSALVFGGFGYTPERLLLPTEGEHRGCVFLFSHDPLQMVRISLSFDGLLDQLRLQPLALLGAYGGASYQGAAAFETDSAH